MMRSARVPVITKLQYHPHHDSRGGGGQRNNVGDPPLKRLHRSLVESTMCGGGLWGGGLVARTSQHALVHVGGGSLTRHDDDLVALVAVLRAREGVLLRQPRRHSQRAVGRPEAQAHVIRLPDAGRGLQPQDAVDHCPERERLAPEAEGVGGHEHHKRASWHSGKQIPQHQGHLGVGEHLAERSRLDGQGVHEIRHCWATLAVGGDHGQLGCRVQCVLGDDVRGFALQLFASVPECQNHADDPGVSGDGGQLLPGSGGYNDRLVVMLGTHRSEQVFETRGVAVRVSYPYSVLEDPRRTSRFIVLVGPRLQPCRGVFEGLDIAHMVLECPVLGVLHHEIHRQCNACARVAGDLIQDSQETVWAVPFAFPAANQDLEVAHELAPRPAERWLPIIFLGAGMLQGRLRHGRITQEEQRVARLDPVRVVHQEATRPLVVHGGVCGPRPEQHRILPGRADLAQGAADQSFSVVAELRGPAELDGGPFK
mmetsp:Transcript_37271/g.106677  ORF Transcript_37271/g.106677 Transcript_37271/m.106677 type:complete len:482 (+) Transcript_37271:484-1929(+)